MIATDVMARSVVSIGPNESVSRAAQLMTENDISALPVVDPDGRLIGIISEADLLHRKEIGSADEQPRWVETMAPAATLATAYARSYGKRVADLMSENVISVSEGTSLNEIAAIFERNRIKRVPVVRDERPIGIVSRTNLIQALASAADTAELPSAENRSIREVLLARLEKQPWTDFGSRNVIVKDGEVHLWGLVGSDAERNALVVLGTSLLVPRLCSLHCWVVLDLLIQVRSSNRRIIIIIIDVLALSPAPRLSKSAKLSISARYRWLRYRTVAITTSAMTSIVTSIDLAQPIKVI